MQIQAESLPRWPLHQRILLGLVIGAAAGWIAHSIVTDSNLLVRFIDHITQPIGATVSEFAVDDCGATRDVVIDFGRGGDW